MSKQYSFTELKGIDWKVLADEYVQRANSARTEREFVNAIVPMLAKLHDIHVWVELPSGEQFYPYHAPYIPNFDHSIVQSQLSNLQQFDRIGFTGRNNNIGVIVIRELPDDADYAPLWATIRNMRDVKAFIVDLRRNSGGSEARAAQIAGLFAKQRTQYALAKVRGADGVLRETPPRVLEPMKESVSDVPVVCLIGPGCVSSGEGFALMMKSLTQVQLIGQPTRGASGNPQPVTLSNGVRVWFSRWISLELDGTTIEGRGVIPKVMIEHTPGSDRTFERAIELLSN